VECHAAASTVSEHVGSADLRAAARHARRFGAAAFHDPLGTGACQPGIDASSAARRSDRDQRPALGSAAARHGRWSSRSLFACAARSAACFARLCTGARDARRSDAGRHADTAARRGEFRTPWSEQRGSESIFDGASAG
jgi:hypothetical protein